jgi:hypothetical protein
MQIIAVASCAAVVIAVLGVLLRGRQHTVFSPEADVVVQLTPNDAVTVEQACSGILVIGATGSGKTSGPGDALIRGLLRQGGGGGGAGALWLTAKVDEAQRARRIVAECGRLGDFIHVCPGSGWVCDPLEVELMSQGGSVQSATQLLELIIELSNRESAGRGDEKFWSLSFQTHFYFAVSAVYLAKGRATIPEVYRLIASGPNSIEEVNSPQWRQSSFCAQCLLEAAESSSSMELELCLNYWLETWARLSDKTKSVVHSATLNLLGKFMVGPVADLVVGDTNLLPSWVNDGKIIVLDVPVLRFKQPGVFYQVMFKTLVANAALRRPITAGMRPAVIHADEAQLFLTSQDPLIQTVARQSGLVSLALTQNLPMLMAQLGGNEKAKQEVESWIAGHQSIFMCANTCPTTNEFFSKILGSSRHTFLTGQMAPTDADLFDMLMGNDQRFTAGFNEQWFPDVPPGEFANLAKGGPRNNFIVEAIAFQSGRIWSNGKNHLYVDFKQGGS